MTSTPHPLTPEELAQRGLDLAHAIHQRATLLAEHAERTKYLRDRVKHLDLRIGELSGVVRSGIEFRSAQLPLREFLQRLEDEKESPS